MALLPKNDPANLIRNLQERIQALEQMETALRESEERFSLAFEHAPIGMALVGLDGRFLRVNRALCDMFGYSAQEMLALPTWQVTHPDDMLVTIEQLRRMVEGELDTWHLEKRFIHRDGHMLWGLSDTSLVRDSDGRPLYVVSQLQDVTEQRRTQEELRLSRERLQTLSRRLLDVQELERQHLSRELHDEIGQSLTGLKLALDAALAHPPPAAQTRLRDAQVLLKDLVARVRNMSLDLRPSMLDDLGLVPALLWLFERYTAQTQVRVNFERSNIEGRFASVVEIAAFRIVQEALTNVARHAHVDRVTVRVWSDGRALGIQVVDDGVGFDAEATPTNAASSGLTGLRERAALLDGQLTIESTPGHGTRLTAELPLDKAA